MKANGVNGEGNQAKSANSTQIFGIHDDDDVDVDDAEEQLGENSNGIVKECNASLQAQLNAMKEIVSTLQESNDSKDRIINIMQEQVDIVDSRYVEAEKSSDEAKSKLAEWHKDCCAVCAELWRRCGKLRA